MADKTIFCRRSTDKDKNVLLGRARVCVVVCRIVGVGVIYDLNLAIDIHNQPKIGDDKWHEQHHIHIHTQTKYVQKIWPSIDIGLKSHLSSIWFLCCFRFNIYDDLRNRGSVREEEKRKKKQMPNGKPKTTIFFCAKYTFRLYWN